MERSEKQERSDVVYIYIELDGERVAEGWRDPLGRRETENGRGSRECEWQGERRRAGDAVGAGGCRRTARVESAKERGRVSQKEEGGFGATVMSVCTRTPSRLRRWRNVATQPHREPRHRGSGSSLTQHQDNARGIRGCAAPK